ncbi:MAG: hypothetical protein MK171_12410 [Pirellulales bacterium]|nr:hypothetical protein [Pirellulales bacterium]
MWQRLKQMTMGGRRCYGIGSRGLRCALLLVVGVTGLVLVCGLELPAEASELRLENDSWRVVVHPEYGGRCSSLYSKTHESEFILNWATSKNAKGVETATGGGFRGHMCGSYASEQVDDPYTVVHRSPTRAEMSYQNEHPLFSGLEEQRVVSLLAGGRTVQLELTVTNRSPEKRTLYYRLNDIMGPGTNNGTDSVYLVPAQDGTVSAIASGPSEENVFFFTPAEPWFALVDPVRDTGLLVEVTQSPIEQVSYWLTPAWLRTAELFFPIAPLSVGQSWKATLRYTVFSPSQPDLNSPRLNAILSTSRVHEHLRMYQLRRHQTGLPLSAAMRLKRSGEPLAITPVHPADPQFGTQEFVRYAGTLEGVTLYGAPGEVVPIAFAVTASQAMTKARIDCTALVDGKKIIPAEQLETRHVSQDGWGYLVHDWELARAGLPDGVCQINNDIRDGKVTTPFDLEVGETAYLWTYLRIPENAAAGRYSGKCSVKQDSDVLGAFNIQLEVYPFRLLPPEDKIRGTFFRYRLKTGTPNEGAANLSQAEYLACLKNMDEMGYNGLTIYDNTRENIFWILDQCAALGWKNRLFIMIHAGSASLEELSDRYGKHGFKFLGWLADEPQQYGRIPDFQRAVARVSPQWGDRCVFTPNTPLGIAMAEAFPQAVPIFAHMGTGPYLVDLTRRYKSAGREVYWYGMPFGKAAVHKRLLNGICLWKEPVDGMVDWGEDSMRRPVGESLTGFAGTTIIPTLARENIRQGYHDLYYLHTLEQAIASFDETDPRTQQAQQLIDTLRNQFHFVFSAEGDRFTQGSMDRIRRQVADEIIALQE